jgi:uncharacterized membrane protein
VVSEQGIGRAFRVSLVLKGLDGVLEIVGGVLLLFVSPASLAQVARWATTHELAEDPRDCIARHLLNAATQASRSATLYGAVYLLVHGIAKVVLVVEVLRDRLWAYPVMLATLGAFIVYQLYRMLYSPSILLVALTVFDVVIVWLTWHEYRLKLARAS